MNIPLNRWTVIVILSLTALLGPDFVSGIMRAVVAVGQAHIPAM